MTPVVAELSRLGRTGNRGRFRGNGACGHEHNDR
jgi:hypothetical protein